MLFPITATIKSFVFSVLNSFFGNTYKKRGWNGDSRRKCEFSGFSVLNTFLGGTYKRGWIEKENKPNGNVGLIFVVMIIGLCSAHILDKKRILLRESLR